MPSSFIPRVSPINNIRSSRLIEKPVAFLKRPGLAFASFSSLLPYNLIRIAGRTPLWILIFLVYASVANATGLNNTPLYSKVTIIVANNVTGLGDKTIVGFNPNSTDTFNPVYDANKLQGETNRETLYTLNGGQWMSINTLPYEATTDTVAMGFEPGSSGTFVMSFTGLNSFDSTSYVYLEDKQTHIIHNLRNGDYTFTSAVTDSPERFLLHFTPPVIITATDSGCLPANTLSIVQPGAAYWNYTLIDSGTDFIVTGVLNQSQPATIQANPGTYMLTLTDTGNYQVTKTFQVVSGPQTTIAAFQLSADSVETGQNIILLGTDTGIISNQWNFGNGILGTGADTTIIYNTPGDYIISLTVTNQAGCLSTTTQSIVVMPAKATEVTKVSVNISPDIRSYDSKIYVTFPTSQAADASIVVYNMLGQVISNEHFQGCIYEKDMDNTSPAYLLVTVNENGRLFSKELFINNK